MPDNEINIKINLNTTESGTSLQRLHQQLNAIIADSERARRQQGWAGVKGIENDTANIKAQIAALQEAKTETQRVRNTNLEYALGPEPTREIITTRRLPAVASSLSMAASGDDEERERRKQALVRETVAVVQSEEAKKARAAEQEQQKQTAAAQREAARRIAIAEREAQAQQQAAMRGYSAADREVQSVKAARERQGDAVIASAVRADEEAQRSAARQQQTIERQVQIQERLAGKGYEAASRDIDREKQARERIGDTIIANAVRTDEEVRKSATRQQQIIERQADIQERDAAKGYEAASRDIVREQQMRERAGDAVIAAAARTDQKVQRDSERQKVIIGRQLDAQEIAAQKGYEAADREIQRETAARQRQAEVEGNAAVRAATARDEAVRKSIKFDEEISHRGVSSAMGEPRVLGYSELESAHYRLQRFRAEQQAESSGIFGRINRIGSLEGQAAVINSIQALASGMSPTHVAMMEIPQVAGAAIQGGLLSFKQILTFIGSSAGIAATTLGTVAAVLGQIIYTGSQARTAMLTTQGSLTARGFGGEGVISQENLIKEREQLKSQFRNVVGSSDINTIFGQFNTAAPEAQQYRGRLASASVALAGTQNIDIEEAAKALGKAAEGGAQGLIDFTKKLNIGDDLSRQRLSVTAISDPSRAFSQALALIEQRTEAGRAATATEGPWLIPALPKIIASVKTDIDQGTVYNSLRYLFTGFAPIDQTKATARVPEQMQVGLGLATAGTPEMKERVELQEKYNKLLQIQRELLQSIENLPQGGPEIDTQMERLSRVNESIRNIERSDRPKGVAETKQDASDMARLQRSLEFAQNVANNDISQAGRVVSARAALNAEITRQHASAVELQKGKTRELTAAEIQADQEREQSRRALAQRSIDIMLQLSNLERARIGPANISAQREIVQRNVATVTANKDVDESVKIGQQTEEVNILRQERMEVENVNIAQLRQGELILQAKEDLAGIVTLRRQEAAIIERSKDRSPADIIQARSNVIQSQIQAATQARRLELEAVNSIGQAEERRYQTVSALLNLQVVRGTANTWQTVPLEQQITSEGTNTQAARLQALLNTGNLERSERIRVNEQLASLYEADAQKQIELQTRVTESIKAENARRTENFKNFFSSIESASSDLLVAGLLKSQTKEQAVKSFATSVVTSFVKETENMASKYAGKGLAKLLDVKLGEGEDSSISSVLAKKAGSVLGITLDEPKLNQAAIADRMKEAGDAQKQAGDLMLQAAREMSTKAQEAPYKGGKGTEFSTDVVRETEKRASTVDTSTTTQRTIPSGTDVYGVPGAVMNYGRSGALGTQEEAAANLTKISAQSGATFQVHKEAAPAFQGLINDLESRGYKINPEESGGYAKREMRGGTGLSEHAFGTAIDINPSKNPWMTHQTDLPSDISEIAAKHGLVWGGNWPTKPDPMHFQWGGPNAGSLVRDKFPEKVVPLDEPVQPTSVQLATTVPRSDYFLNNVSKVEQVKPQAYKDIEYKITPDGQIISSKEISTPVRSGMPDINTLGAPGGPKGMDYIFGKNIPRPEVDSSGNITKYGVDPKQAEADRVSAGWNRERAQNQQNIKVDSASVAQGVQQGQQQVVSEFRSSIQEGTIQGQAATVSATNRDVQQTETNARNVESNSTKTETNTQKLETNTQSLDKLASSMQSISTQQGGTGSATSGSSTVSSGTTYSSGSGDPLTAAARKVDPNAPDVNDITSSRNLTPERRQELITYITDTNRPSGYQGLADAQPFKMELAMDRATGYNYIPAAREATLQQLWGKSPVVQGLEYAGQNPNSAPVSTKTFGDNITWRQIDKELAAKGLNPEGNALGTPLAESPAFYYYRTAVDPKFEPQRINAEGTGLESITFGAQQQQAISQNSSQLQETNSSIRDLNQTINSKDSGSATVGTYGAAGGSGTIGASGVSTASTDKTAASVGGLGSAASTAQNGLSLFSSAAGIASSAALLFGKNLSPTGKAIVGGIGLASNLLSFGTKAASLFAAPATGGLSLAGLFEGGGVVSAERGTIVTPIPSAAGGMFVKEHALPSSVLSGIQSMARGGQAGAFVSSRMVSGPRVNDGKGGQLIIAHDGEMVVPRAETTMILNSIKNPVVPSAEAGMILDNRGGAAISMSPPKASNLRSNIDNSIREAITNVASTSSTNNTNNNTTLNYTAHTTGYHPYRTRSDFESMLRQHGSTVMRWAESNFRNGSWPQRSF